MRENKPIVIARPIKDFPDYYITNIGEVYSRKMHNPNGRIKKMRTPANEDGYLRVGLWKKNVCRVHFVHRLVASAFIPNKDKTLEVNHKNGIKADNRVENLEWVSHPENMKHSFAVLKRGKRQILCVEKDKIFDSIADAAKFFKTVASNIGGVIDNPNRTACGFHWKYADGKGKLIYKQRNK